MPHLDDLYDVAILGAGPVGLFCSFQASHIGLSNIIIDSRLEVGGQCSALYPMKPIYDIPGFDVITAGQLVSNLKSQADHFNPAYLLGQYIKDFQYSDSVISLTSSEEVQIKAKSLIIATGGGLIRPKKPPIAGIEALEGSYVFYDVKDPQHFTDKTIVIAGGGDSAIDWTLVLSDYAKHIYLVHRRTTFRAADNSLKRLQKLIDSGKLTLIAPYQLLDIRDNMVIVQDLDGGIKELQADALLAFFGLETQGEVFLQSGLKTMDGLIEVDPLTMQTNFPKVYAIGDIATYHGKLKLILTGFAEAATACYNARAAINPGKFFHFEYSTTKGRNP